MPYQLSPVGSLIFDLEKYIQNLNDCYYSCNDHKAINTITKNIINMEQKYSIHDNKVIIYSILLDGKPVEFKLTKASGGYFLENNHLDVVVYKESIVECIEEVIKDIIVYKDHYEKSQITKLLPLALQYKDLFSRVEIK